LLLTSPVTAVPFPTYTNPEVEDVATLFKKQEFIITNGDAPIEIATFVNEHSLTLISFIVTFWPIDIKVSALEEAIEMESNVVDPLALPIIVLFGA